ncbi:uncharacterized protein I303_103809 [Kwoniella dejecticola CBS 10117]|uniref:Uncharacterized protein n=1 Tax=Kwoniella dejecticola CBS 10117 TaxID=1296121 RepID=A0A1A6A7S5_9TREE|nr:uncharacterized protein I303_03828 [Kwoniella dejecticola CBS 10117]OBR86109.1 hypothetical protein I303_03828 [Kwoniella dejecticola CBS 10117]
MQFLSSIFIAFTVLLSSILPLASAKIYHISLPEQALPGENITVTVSSSSYIQNWDDFGIIWGLVGENHGCEGCVGQEIGYENLYGNNTLGNSTYSVQLPNTTTRAYTFVAAVPYLVGASGETGIHYFNQSINLISNAKVRV